MTGDTDTDDADAQHTDDAGGEADTLLSATLSAEDAEVEVEFDGSLSLGITTDHVEEVANAVVSALANTLRSPPDE